MRSERRLCRRNNEHENMSLIAYSRSASEAGRLWWVLWAVAALMILFWGNGAVTLWDEDEAAYALFGKTMLETGDWWVPDFTWSDIHRKTPFHFWAIACSFAVFGVNEWALRLPTVLAFCGVLWLMWSWGGRLWGQRRAAFSVVVLMSSVFVPTLAKIALTDMWLLLAQTGAALALMLVMEEKEEAQARRMMLYFSAFLALGILVKGPPIVILAGGMWWVALLAHERGRRLLRWWALLSLVLGAVPFLLWIWGVWQSGRGDFLVFLYDWYVAKRVGGSVLGQTGWAGYHLGVLLVSFLPMLVLVLAAVGQWRRWWAERRGLMWLVLGWLAFGWWFYELMSSKLPTYSLSVQPLLAVGAASVWLSWERRRAEAVDGAAFWAGLSLWLRGVWYLWAMLWLAIGLGAWLDLPAAWLGAWAAGILSGEAVRFWLLGLGALALGAVWCLRRGELSAAWGALAALGLGLHLGAWALVAPQVESSPMKGLARVAQAVRTACTEGQAVALVEFKPSQTKPSLLYYLGQGLPMGSNAARSRVFEQISAQEALERVWANPQQPQVFLAGAETGDWLRNVQAHFPAARVDTLHWWSTDDQLREHPFYLVQTHPVGYTY